MDGTDQPVADGGLAIAGSGQPRIHGFQMAANFGTQDFQQHRIHADRRGMRLASCIGCDFNHRLCRRSNRARLH